MSDDVVQLGVKTQDEETAEAIDQIADWMREMADSGRVKGVVLLVVLDSPVNGPDACKTTSRRAGLYASEAVWVMDHYKMQMMLDGG